MTNSQERRESILEVFNKAKEDLECLNGDIQNQIESNQAQIIALTNQNAELSALKVSNESSIKTFAKFFQVTWIASSYERRHSRFIIWRLINLYVRVISGGKHFVNKYQIQ